MGGTALSYTALVGTALYCTLSVPALRSTVLCCTALISISGTVLNILRLCAISHIGCIIPTGRCHFLTDFCHLHLNLQFVFIVKLSGNCLPVLYLYRHGEPTSLHKYFFQHPHQFFFSQPGQYIILYRQNHLILFRIGNLCRSERIIFHVAVFFKLCQNTVTIYIHQLLRRILCRKLELFIYFYCHLRGWKQLLLNLFFCRPDIILDDQSGTEQINPQKIPAFSGRDFLHGCLFHNIMNSAIQLQRRKHLKKRFTHTLTTSYSCQWSSSSFSTASSCSSGTFRIIWPFLINSPSPIPPAIPISASLASPGPFTAQPITATLISSG